MNLAPGIFYFSLMQSVQNGKKLMYSKICLVLGEPPWYVLYSTYFAYPSPPGAHVAEEQTSCVIRIARADYILTNAVSFLPSFFRAALAVRTAFTPSLPWSGGIPPNVGYLATVNLHTYGRLGAHGPYVGNYSTVETATSLRGYI